jgi:hypothetical protein
MRNADRRPGTRCSTVDGIAVWSLESPVIGNGHAGLYVERPVMLTVRAMVPVFPAMARLHDECRST